MATAPATPHRAPVVEPTAVPSSTASSVAIDSSDTSLVTLSPAFLEALRKVVPTRRRAKLPYIIALGLLAVVGVLGADRSTREFMAARPRHAAAAVPQRVDPAKANRIVPPTATSDPQVDNPVVPVASATASTSPTGATSKKTRPRRAPPQVKEKRPISGS